MNLDQELAALEQVMPAGQPCDIEARIAEFIAAEVDHGDLEFYTRLARRRRLHRPTRDLLEWKKRQTVAELAA